MLGRLSAGPLLDARGATVGAAPLSRSLGRVSTSSTPRRRRRKAVRILAGCTVLLALAGYLTAQYVTGGAGPARCTVRAGGSGSDAVTYEVEPEQAANAATIEAVASSRGLPDRAVTIALATAMQESALHNLRHGDRDSLGLFQQRPSQGWGTAQQILDPVYAAGKFYDHLVKIPGYSRLPLTVAAQKVQHSGFPQAYAKHEANASLLTAALTGRRAAALTCTAGPRTDGGEAGDPAQVRRTLVREFGDGVLPHTTAQAVSLDGVAEDAGGAARDEVTIPAPTKQRGWELAHWALAQAEQLHIAHISYGRYVWDADRSAEGGRTVRDAGANGVVGLRTADGAAG
jgi:hypothetical protein